MGEFICLAVSYCRQNSREKWA